MFNLLHRFSLLFPTYPAYSLVHVSNLTIHPYLRLSLRRNRLSISELVEKGGGE